MKRKIVKRWDDVNGRLTADYFQIYYYNGEPSTVHCTRFYSPLHMLSPSHCKGKMYASGKYWYGAGFIKDLYQLITED